MTTEQRQTLAKYMRERADECRKEAQEETQAALDAMRSADRGEIVDSEAIEIALSAALLALGEARGFNNAASDIEEG